MWDLAVLAASEYLTKKLYQVFCLEVGTNRIIDKQLYW